MSGAAESKMAKSDPPTNQDADPSDSGERPVTDADAVAGLHPSSDGHDINDAFSDTSAVGGDEQPSDLKNDPKACSCSCHTGSAHCMFDEKLSESIRFRELLILHLDMIEEQSALLQLKEKQLFNLKIENEQVSLMARMHICWKAQILEVIYSIFDQAAEYMCSWQIFC